ncbi:MAG: hypothetical protein HYY30_01115 [Chloroflexi bacterium]|nr:hypothetical protein [Chloroflexota bacterium]
MHRLTTTPATLASWQAGQGSGRGSTTVVSGQPHHTPYRPVALAVTKRGRPCIIAKLVLASPLGETVLAMPYRHRQTVAHASIPPSILSYARQHGARLWLVRLDADGRCYALPLADVERVGWLRPSDGCPEWFVPLARFTAVRWEEWDYVTDVVRLDAEPADVAERQLALW